MSTLDNSTVESAAHVLAAYGLRATALESITGGLINLTVSVTTADDAQYVLQRLNPIFNPEVNLNLELVTRHLAAQGQVTPRLVPALNGAWWVLLDKACWRLLTFVPGECFATLPGARYAHSAGQLLGRFHCALATVVEPLPYRREPVHAPARHFANLRHALTQHAGHPLSAKVQSLAVAIAEASAGLPPLAVQPLRLLHGDPKLSNLRFNGDASPGCMLDLDTLTEAPLAYELGDAFRSWCNPQPEDAVNADFDLALFSAAVEGYAEDSRAFITPQERASIVSATEMIYLELAARFAADAVNEAYFGWDAVRFATRGEHNLTRAQNQMAAAAALRAQRVAAARCVRRVFED